MTQLSEHFQAEEFRCRHCGRLAEIDPDLVAGLELVRAHVRMPVVVISGWRCPQHPETLLRPGGMHPTGRAADIRVVGFAVPQLYRVCAGIPQFNRGGVGIYSDGFVHVDTRGAKARWGNIGGVYTSFKVAWEWIKNGGGLA